MNKLYLMLMVVLLSLLAQAQTYNEDLIIDSTNYDLFVDDSANSVGLGTSSPTLGKLQIQATGNNQSLLYIRNYQSASGSDTATIKDGDSYPHTIFKIQADADADAGGPFNTIFPAKGGMETNYLGLYQTGDTTYWNFDVVTDAGVSSNDILEIAPDSSSYSVLFPYESSGMRMYIWDSTSVPNIPHTGVKPGLAVKGPMLIQDIGSLNLSNPLTIFYRNATGLSAYDQTNIFCAKGINTDTDGGAGMVLHPDDNSSDDSGVLNLIGYGQGGALAGSVRFKTRSASGTASDRMVVTGAGNVGIGTTSPGAKLSVSGEVRLSGIATSRRLVCIKSDGTLGQCTNNPNSSGVCTCS